MEIETKREIKETIENLPMGKEFLLPLIRSTVNLWNIRGKYIKRKTEINETKKIINACQSAEIKDIYVIYDMLSSAPTYGDFFYVVMLARFFKLYKKNVHFYIVNSEYRQDALNAYTVKELDVFVEKLLEIPRILFNKGKPFEVGILKWKDVEPLLQQIENYESAFIPFKEQVFNRLAFYNYSFNVINELFKINGFAHLKNYLLSKDEIRTHVTIELPDIPYITWHCRYSEKWSKHRNITDKEFEEIYFSLKNIFPDHKIMIVSDKTGCNFFRELCKKKGIEALFSKDFSNSFMDDVALILGSNFFFTLRGGGISSTAVFSEIPYILIAKPIHETPYSKSKLAVWANQRQILINTDNIKPKEVFRYIKI